VSETGAGSRIPALCLLGRYFGVTFLGYALRLLRPSRSRPRGSRASEQREEVATLHHSITSSARARIAAPAISHRRVVGGQRLDVIARVDDLEGLLEACARSR
jgi:hypothetical protein